MKENKFCLYEYKRKSSYIDTINYLLITETYIYNTSKEKPLYYYSTKDYEEYYKLLLILTLEEGEVIELEAQELSNKTNKEVRYNNKIYKPIDYQTKVGREVAAHQIDVNSNRISSYNRSYQSLPIKDKRDNIQAKVYYDTLIEEAYKNEQSNETKINTYLINNITNLKESFNKAERKHCISKKKGIAKILAAIEVITQIENELKLKRNKVVYKEQKFSFLYHEEVIILRESKSEKTKAQIKTSLSFKAYYQLVETLILLFK